ncbi:hypothetical protein GCM10009640_04110 [Agrococcus citreus]|uniref:Uncharacterized protein n=1 Tax=Agrococcus citreus TaxID=84643 RepID=A0ABP4JC66_9MICO
MQRDRAAGDGGERGLRRDGDGEADAADADDEPLSACGQHGSVEPRDHAPSLGLRDDPGGLPRRRAPAGSLA